ncbi:MAG: ABC transporter substrate-binding protein [Methylococcales bacterium]|nr:ABC transporter substrate-binding protein [Methylococcales bacterium]
MRVHAQGLPLAIVLVFDISAGADQLLTRPDIKQLSDLAGQRIGYESGAVGELMLAKILTEAGLSREQLQVIPLPFYQHESAWSQQTIDALITFEPAATKLKNQGARLLYDSRKLPEILVDVLVIRQDRLQQRQKALKHLLKAHFRALKHQLTSPDDSRFRLSTWLKATPADINHFYRYPISFIIIVYWPVTQPY